MNIESLSMFCNVVEEGSISVAARLGYLSQPAVTRQIRQLEKVYGIALFDRVGGKLKLTDAGQLLYPYAKEMVNINKHSFDEIKKYQGEMSQTLHVGASLTIGEYLLPALIGRFKKSHPDVQFSLSIGNTPYMLSKLELNEIDIALVEGTFDNGTFSSEKFADDELILVAAHNHRWNARDGISLNELSEEKMIWREKESGTREIVEEALKKHNVLDDIETSMELGSMQAIKSAVEADLGVSILPKLTILKELKYDILSEIPIEGFYLVRDFWMVGKKQRFKSETLKSFEKFLMR